MGDGNGDEGVIKFSHMSADIKIYELVRGVICLDTCDVSAATTGVGEGDEAVLLEQFPCVTRVYQSLPASSQLVIAGEWMSPGWTR